jgi:phage-related tail fiber protein
MTYPAQIDQYPVKLNKKTDGSVYVVEEELPIVDGKFEGLLAHDNIANTSIRVYTGSKLTGKEIINYIISVPTDTSWRRHIKVFADVSKVYVTYETPGDTVEADDVNVLQGSMTATQGEVDRYKAANDAVVVGVDARLKVAEANKAEKTYVDSQLLLKADKVNTYTKTETDQRIQNVVAAAPEALDTLQEIAEALNNDPDFAGTMTTQLAGKVDKVSGKGLSTEDYTAAEKTKLAGIATGAGTAGSAADSVIGSRTISDAEAPSGNTGMLTSLLGWLANMIKSITGKSTWRTAPAITLEATKAHVDNATDAHNVANRIETAQLAVNGYVDQRIAALVNNAPETLNTLYELANAIDNDPDFATKMIDLIDQKLNVSEVVSTATANKVLRLNANGKLPATVIAQTLNYRFVTDAEKAAWDAQASLTLGETSSTAYRGDRGKIAYDHSQTAHAPSNANYYAHPNSGVAAGTYRSVTVNAQGHVTTGINPTTLAGYGITDAVNSANAATQAEAEAGANNTKYMTPLRVKQAIDAETVVAKPGFYNLKASTNSSSVVVTADYAVLRNSSGAIKILLNININRTVVIGTTLLDNGFTVVANNTWYKVWLIYNPATGAKQLILSAETATSPTLLSGYTHYVFVMCVRGTNGSLYHLKKTSDGKVKYIVDGTILTNLRVVASGTATQWTECVISSFVPITAHTIILILSSLNSDANGVLRVAPNNNYVDFFAGAYFYNNVFALMGLESSSIYIVSGNARNAVYAAGWIDNL